MKRPTRRQLIQIALIKGENKEKPASNILKEVLGDLSEYQSYYSVYPGTVIHQSKKLLELALLFIGRQSVTEDEIVVVVESEDFKIFSNSYLLILFDKDKMEKAIETISA